jgi:hypothetical protein
MIESLVGDDPRRSADRLLCKMCEIAGAEGGAVLVPQDQNAAVFLSYRLSLGGLTSLTVRFQDHRVRLGAGETVTGEGFALASITGEGDAPSGWVYLEEPRSSDTKELRPFLLAMAKALTALGQRTAEPVKVASRSEANRANLIKMLEANDWNIARASRDLKVTRRTLYLRLAAFGIPRKKVPRLAKPLIA